MYCAKQIPLGNAEMINSGILEKYTKEKVILAHIRNKSLLEDLDLFEPTRENLKI